MIENAILLVPVAEYALTMPLADVCDTLSLMVYASFWDNVWISYETKFVWVLCPNDLIVPNILFP